MPYEEILLNAQEHMDKTIARLKSDLSGIRTGRANPGLVDSLRVVVYGSATPIKQIASVTTPEPRQILIRPYDAGTTRDIEKAIQSADLGLNPMSDGKLIRLSVPPLSTEVRKKMVSRVKEIGEEAKIALRNIRRDANKKADTAQKDKKLSEDQRDELKADIQEYLKKLEGSVDKHTKEREKEVLEN